MNGSAGPQRVAVTPGASNDHYVEIVSGLQPGQRVLLYNPKLVAPKTGDDPVPGAKGEQGEGDEKPGQEGEDGDADAAGEQAEPAVPVESGSAEPAASVGAGT